MTRPERDDADSPALHPLERALAASPNWALVIGVTLVLGSIVVAGAMLLDLDLPARALKIAVVAALIGFGWSGPTYRRVRSLLVPQKWGSVLVELGAEEPEDARVIGYRPGAFDVEVVEDAIEWTSPSLAFAESVTLVEDGPDEVVGSWYGSASGRELLAAKAKIAEVRGRLEDDAKRGFVLDSSIGSIVRAATMDATREVVDVVDELSLPDGGDALSSAVDDALERFGLGEDSKAEDDHREATNGRADEDVTPGGEPVDDAQDDDGEPSVPYPGTDAGGDSDD